MQPHPISDSGSFESILVGAVKAGFPSPAEELRDLDCLIIAVSHKEFKALSNKDIDAMFKDGPNGGKIIIDVKGARNKDELLSLGYRYWRL